MDDDVWENVVKVVLVGYWLSEVFLTQYNPFCYSIISSSHTTRAHSNNIIIKNGYSSH